MMSSQENPDVDSSQSCEQAEPLAEASHEVQTGTELPFALIRPKHCPPRLDKLRVVEKVMDKEHLLELLRSLHLADKQPPETVLDLETTGTKAFLPSVKVVSVGFSNAYGSISLDFRDTPELYNACIFLLYGWQVPLIAFNVAFDAAFLTRDLNLALNGGVYPQWFHEWKWHNWIHCAYASYRQFASCGWVGQQWGLKLLMVQVLKWPEANEREKSRWLVENGFVKKQPAKALLAKLQGGNDAAKDD